MRIRNTAIAALLLTFALSGCAADVDPIEANNGQNNGANNGQGQTCEEIEAAYTDLVDNQTCAQDSDCQRVDGQCGVGLGGCYHAVNSDVSQDDINALGQSYNEGGCTGAVCDCAEPQDVFCNDGTCDWLPFCEGRELGETFPAEDGCNTCTCTVDGVVCTDEECNVCDTIEGNYEAAIADASACSEHADCQTLWGQCGAGLGGCHVFANMSLTQQALSDYGLAFRDAGCTGAVCRCTAPPNALCVDGACAQGPYCDGHGLGESWTAEDGCNTCTCTEEGTSCTELDCNSCEGIEQAYDRLVDGNNSCETVDDCQVLFGQCGVGLGGCYEAVNQDVTQDELGALGRQYNEMRCIAPVCSCAPPPSPSCDDGTCGFAR